MSHPKFEMPELTIEGLNDHTEAAQDKVFERSLDVYGHIGSFAFNAVADKYPSLRNAGVEHGFNVNARLIRIAENLYPTFTSQPSSVDLRNILLRSQETPRRLADLPAKTNSAVEYYFGVSGDKDQRNFEDLFTFETVGDGRVLFILDDDNYSAAVREGRTGDSEALSGKKCPFIEINTGMIWPAMVKLAASAPQAFMERLESPKAA